MCRFWDQLDRISDPNYRAAQSCCVTTSLYNFKSSAIRLSTTPLPSNNFGISDVQTVKRRDLPRCLEGRNQMAVDDVVVVTGFGPFSTFTENPSSQIVDELERQKIPGFDGRLVTEKMNCLYAEVDETVKRLWKEHSPKLVVHIGVHPHIHRQINLEQRSFGRGYCRYDNEGCVPVDNVCSTCSDPILKSSIDCNAIASQVARELEFKNLRVKASDDPGRFLCAYSFYLSLSFDVNRAIFIHVPPFDSSCTLEMVTAAVQTTIVAILSSLDGS